MTQPVFTVETQALRRAMKILDDSFGKRGRNLLMSRIARELRDRTRKRITSQGEGTWAPLSKWTQARTGRRKALVTLRKNVKARWNADEAAIYFEPVSNKWDLTDHHRGFTSPAVNGKRMSWNLVRPTAIGLRQNKISIMSRKASVIPARDVWSTDRKTKIWVNTQINKYTQAVEAKINGVG